MSDSVDVTMGVLQGEILSPLLLILFITDLETFIRHRETCEISVNSMTYVLALLYADDLVIPAHFPIDIHRKLALIQEYCELNGLCINVNKTQILPFNAKGRHEDIRIFRCG